MLHIFSLGKLRGPDQTSDSHHPEVNRQRTTVLRHSQYTMIERCTSAPSMTGICYHGVPAELSRAKDINMHTHGLRARGPSADPSDCCAGSYQALDARRMCTSHIGCRQSASIAAGAQQLQPSYALIPVEGHVGLTMACIAPSIHNPIRTPDRLSVTGLAGRKGHLAPQLHTPAH